jgi:hypothetical protein
VKTGDDGGNEIQDERQHGDLRTRSDYSNDFCMGKTYM